MDSEYIEPKLQQTVRLLDANAKAPQTSVSSEVPAEISSRLFAITLANVFALLIRSPIHRDLSLAAIEEMIYPALISEQFLIAEAKLLNGQVVPAAVVFWARVSASIDARLSSSCRYPIRLKPEDWQSGDQFWVVDGAGSPEIIHLLIHRLAETVFAGKQFKSYNSDEGKVQRFEVREGASLHPVTT